MTPPRARPFAIEPEPASVSQPALADRGRLLFAEDVSREIFGGRKSVWWVTHNLPKDGRLKVGRHVAWFENDIRTWLETRREDA
jgi:hypothetical protein